VVGRCDRGRGVCHARSARVRSVECQVFSSTEDKSHSGYDLTRFSSRVENSVETSSSERGVGRERIMRERAFEVVYRTMVSYVRMDCGEGTLSERDVSRESIMCSRFSVISISTSFCAGSSMIPILCMIFTRSFLDRALDCVISDSVRCSMFIVCGTIARLISLSECPNKFAIVHSNPVFSVNSRQRVHTSKILLSGEVKVVVAHSMNGSNSVFQTSLLPNTLAHRMALASRSFPADLNLRFDKFNRRVTKLSSYSDDCIVAKSNGARQVSDNHSIRI
jgi:hypothetical protein